MRLLSVRTQNEANIKGNSDRTIEALQTELRLLREDRTSQQRNTEQSGSNPTIGAIEIKYMKLKQKMEQRFATERQDIMAKID